MSGPADGGPLRAGEAPAPGYRVVEHLRRGADLDVYDAWSQERECRCVIKTLRPDRRRHDPARRRLRAEGRLLLELRHPHIVQAYELVVRPDPVLAIQTLQGETVGHLVGGRQRRLAVVEVAHLGLHLCSAMNYLHSRGYLHLDLKPSNVIAEFGQAKVIDFSLARRAGRARRGVGTMQYLSPEQATGARVGPAADAWGIGVVLFEALTGVRAFPGGVAGALRSPNGQFAWPSRGRISELRRLPRDLVRLVEGCLEQDAKDRPTVPQISAGLDAFT